MNSPDVSVVIVSWNTRTYLLACLQALPAALGEDLSFEVIVVDNASSDGSAAAARVLGTWVQVIANAQNKFYTAAANQGLEAARGRHLVLLNPDTIPHPGSLRRLVGHAQLHPDVGLVGPLIVDETGQADLRSGRCYPTPWSEFLDWAGISRRFPHSRLWAANLRPNFDRSQTAAVPLLSGACLLLPEHLPKTIKYLDERYPMYAEDVDLSRRIQAAGYRTVLVAEAVVEHLGGRSSQQIKTKTALLAVDGINRYFRQWHGVGAARRHRLAVATVAAAKWLAYGFLGVLRWSPTLAEQRHLYSRLLWWALLNPTSASIH